MNIYFPITANVLTPGHIQCLEYLAKRGFVYAGLLTSKALKGYKKERMPYKDREFILNTIARAVEDVFVVPQDSLDPTENISRYHCKAIASGDGWEKVELDVIKRYNLKRIDIRLDGEKYKYYSSSKIKWKRKKS